MVPRNRMNQAQAMSQLTAYLDRNGNNTVAQYNMAVLLDASGQYEEALAYYGKATTSSTKDYYATMKAECEKRLADQKALSTQ